MTKVLREKCQHEPWACGSQDRPLQDAALGRRELGPHGGKDRQVPLTAPRGTSRAPPSPSRFGGVSCPSRSPVHSASLIRLREALARDSRSSAGGAVSPARATRSRTPRRPRARPLRQWEGHPGSRPAGCPAKPRNRRPAGAAPHPSSPWALLSASPRPGAAGRERRAHPGPVLPQGAQGRPRTPRSFIYVHVPGTGCLVPQSDLSPFSWAASQAVV